MFPYQKNTMKLYVSFSSFPSIPFLFGHLLYYSSFILDFRHVGAKLVTVRPDNHRPTARELHKPTVQEPYALHVHEYVA